MCVAFLFSQHYYDLDVALYNNKPANIDTTTINGSSGLKPILATAGPGQ